MNPPHLFFILQARWKVALLVALVSVATVLGVSQMLPKRYLSETSLMVDIKSPDPVAAMMIPGTMGTQVDIIRSDRVARKVAKMLRLDESPAMRQMWLNATEGRGKLEDWLADLLQRGLKVTPSRDSNIINLVYQGTDPGFVTAVVNAYAQAYIETALELKVEPARQYARWFGDQAKVLRENVEKAQARLSEFQQDKGIVATDENRDYETARLNDLSAQLTAAQGETRHAQSKQRSGSGAADALPEVLGNPVVAGLRSSIAQMEGKFKEAAGNLGSRHPQYLRMEAELAEMKNRLEAETRHVTGGYTSSSAVGRTREAELTAAIQAQKKKLLQLKTERDQLAVLVRDVEAAKKAYDAVANRFNQTYLESQATQSNIVVLTPGVEPLEPSFPKPFRTMLLMAIALGIMLGLASAYGLEMIDRRVRSAEDLADMLPLPVIGVIERSGEAIHLLTWRGVLALPRK